MGRRWIDRLMCREQIMHFYTVCVWGRSRMECFVCAGVCTKNSKNGDTVTDWALVANQRPPFNLDWCTRLTIITYTISNLARPIFGPATLLSRKALWFYIQPIQWPFCNFSSMYLHIWFIYLFSYHFLVIYFLVSWFFICLDYTQISGMCW